MQYYQVLISAEQTTQGLRILEHLMAKQLVLGGPVFNGPSKFLWNFKASAVPQGMQKDGLYIDEHDYCFAITYTREDLKKQLIEEAEKASVEEVCMISFIPMEGNSALIKLLEGTFAGRETATSPPKPVDAVAALTFVQESEIAFRTKKSLDLPIPVAAYFSADKLDAEAISQCFTEKAVVKDEGHTYNGRAEIKQWKTSASKKYQYTNQPFSCEQEGGKTVVTSRLVGNFPGSPVNLRFFFGLEGNKIASLEINT